MTLKYDDHGRPYEDQGDLAKRVKELDNSLSIALKVNDTYQRESVNLEKQKEFLKAACKIAGETIKALQKEVEELKANLARAKEDHQYDNLVHQKELESLRKK